MLNPSDQAYVSVLGKTIFKCYKLVDNIDENNVRKSTLEIV